MNSEQQRRANLKKRNGITLDQYEQMLAAQGGCCAICGTDDPGQRSFHVDHDHACCPSSKKACGNCTRSLLCGNCNKGLGLLRDDPELLRLAAAYLEAHV